MSSRRLASRMLSAYAESEPWQAEHDAAMLSYEVDEAIAYGNSLFRGLTNDDALWQAHVQKGTIPYQEEDRLQLAEDYRSWIETSEKILSTAERLSREGFAIGGLDEFRQNLEEVQCILAAEEFETALPPVEELLPMADRGNPRPERYGD